MSGQMYTVGVLIRSFNEAQWIQRCVDSMREQESDLIRKIRILVIDSGSTDGTASLARKQDCEVLEIPKSSFNYGRTLNQGFDILSDCDLIACISAHAIPVNRNFLHQLVNPFSNPRVAASYARQIPWKDVDFAERIRIESMFPEVNDDILHTDFNKLSFSNAASCVRRSCWKERAFLELPASEDYEWATYMIGTKGKFIQYVPSAVIFHSHTESTTKRAGRLLEFLEKRFLEDSIPKDKQSLLVFRNGLQNIKWTFYLILNKNGTVKEKATALIRSIRELFAMMKIYRGKNVNV